MCRSLFAVLLTAFFLCLARPCPAAELPYEPGEKLRFLLRWGPIEVGEAYFEVERSDAFAPDGLHFRVTILSNSFADKIFKVRDYVDSFTAPDMSRSLHFKQKQQEGSYRRDIVVEFDWERLKARYSNEGKPRDPIDIAPGSQDPLSAFYAFRLFDPSKFEQVAVPVTDGKKLVHGSAQRIERQSVEIKSGVYDTWLVEPKLEGLGGIFRKSPRARLLVWITADERRIPVMVKSSLMVGSFTAELLSAEGLKPSPTLPPTLPAPVAP